MKILFQLLKSLKEKKLDGIEELKVVLKNYYNGEVPTEESRFSLTRSARLKAQFDFD
ncbi:MAG: hypothetical protein F6K55_15335 [Moorea sp. SIO4A3]|nr:hypothetical protein [Moorena sp. SIO4A3]